MNDQAVTPPEKTPLDFALEAFATPEARDAVLRVTHAVLSHCMVKSALERAEKSAEQIAAEAKVYATLISQVQRHLPKLTSVPIPPMQTRYVADVHNRQ